MEKNNRLQIQSKPFLHQSGSTPSLRQVPQETHSQSISTIYEDQNDSKGINAISSFVAATPQLNKPSFQQIRRPPSTSGKNSERYVPQKQQAHYFAQNSSSIKENIPHAQNLQMQRQGEEQNSSKMRGTQSNQGPIHQLKPSNFNERKSSLQKGSQHLERHPFVLATSSIDNRMNQPQMDRYSLSRQPETLPKPSLNIYQTTNNTSGTHSYLSNANNRQYLHPMTTKNSSAIIPIIPTITQGHQGSQIGINNKTQANRQISPNNGSLSQRYSSISAQNCKQEKFHHALNVKHQTLEVGENLNDKIPRLSLYKPVMTHNRRKSQEKQNSEERGVGEKMINDNFNKAVNILGPMTSRESLLHQRSFGIGCQPLFNKPIFQNNKIEKASSKDTKILQKSDSLPYNLTLNKNEQISLFGNSKSTINLRLTVPSESPNRNITSQTREVPAKKMSPSKAAGHSIGNIQPSSTKNSNLKGVNENTLQVNKLTCISTRNNSQKVNIFQTQQQSKSTVILKVDDKAIAHEPKQQSHRTFEETALQPAHKILVPNHEPTKHSLKRNGLVRAYAANTNQGLVRNYNEDRVSIILNILKPESKAHIPDEKWPRCSFFAIYDGHGGAGCADYLRDNLHQIVIQEDAFPQDPKEAIRSGFARAEKEFLKQAVNEDGSKIRDKSGSCAITVMIIEDMCYIANVGDSRVVISMNEGKIMQPLTRDHKPSDENEIKRIQEAGGHIYHRSANNLITHDTQNLSQLIGPIRVLPGRLSVSRTFGDAEAKLPQFGGNPKVVIASPEITSFKISQTEHDFLVLGCDGIFDKMSNHDVAQCVWNSVADNRTLKVANNVHKQSGMGVEYILKNSLLRRTLDNVTVVMVAFNNFKRAVFGESSINEYKQKLLHESKPRAKENIPPQAQIMKERNNISNQIASGRPIKPLHSLNIDTNLGNISNAPKSTSNAVLTQVPTKQTQGQDIIKKKPSNDNKIIEKAIPRSTNNRQSTGAQKHFDFTHA